MGTTHSRSVLNMRLIMAIINEAFISYTYRDVTITYSLSVISSDRRKTLQSLYLSVFLVSLRMTQAPHTEMQYI